MSIVISLDDRRKLASNLVHFDPKRRKSDCQGDGYTMSALKGSVRLIDPGMDLDEIAKERQRRHEAAVWQHWVVATKTIFREMRDPLPHALKYLNDMKGRRHE
jgi:hypothetical protein